jgi:hypothetical protein
MTSILGLIIFIIGPPQVCPQFQQVLELTLTDMVSQNGHEYILIVCAVCNLLDEVNMTVFRSLGAEILGPAEQDKFPYLVQNTVRLLKFPCILHTISSQEVLTSNSAAVMPNFRDIIFHSNVAACALIKFSLGSSSGAFFV